MTTKPTHTPGPWFVVSDKENRYSDIRIHRDSMCSLATTWTSEAHEANARLIAAAPELLLAAKQVAKAFPGWFKNSKLEAAIAKAEGKS